MDIPVTYFGWFGRPLFEIFFTRTVSNLTKCYYNSVDGNAMLLVNIPPNNRGELPDRFINRLVKARKRIEKCFENKAEILKTESDGNIFTVSIKPHKVKTVVISEDITKSQRIEKFHITAGNRTVYSGTTVGYKKICRLKRGIRNCAELKIHIYECRKEPHIAGDKGILIARCIRVIHKFGRFLGGAAAALVCIMFIFSATVSALPLDIGFSTTKLSAEERNRFLGSINFESTNKESDWESISCFDVSDSGYIAIVGESKNGHNSISVYDKDGKFAYGYTLDCSGRFGVGWDGDNIAVYFVREDIAATFDRNANNITCDEIPDTTANSSYWSNEVLYKTRRVKNGVRYEMKNTGKVASAISPVYAVFEMTEPDGTVHVIFDNSKDYDIKLIKTCIAVVVSFTVVASILTLKTIEDRKKNKTKNK